MRLGRKVVLYDEFFSLLCEVDYKRFPKSASTTAHRGVYRCILIGVIFHVWISLLMISKARVLLGLSVLLDNGTERNIVVAQATQVMHN